ncbi:MAG TPA: hypothetical protein VHE99_02790 [Gammaproteobacteria bacterium]|nr:hypothetical protein [Gammaproteobacteria bacterium]
MSNKKTSANLIKRKGAGGKLNRSEILQARLNPKLRFTVELMARLERRTVSSFIEGLIEKAAKESKIKMTPREQAHGSFILPTAPPQVHTTVEKAVRQMWEPDEADRFVAFALCAPDLLSDYEEKLWVLIRTCEYFWQHFQIDVKNEKGKVVSKRWLPVTAYSGIIREHLHEYWPLLNEIAAGNKPASKLWESARGVGQKVKKPVHYPGVTEVQRKIKNL